MRWTLPSDEQVGLDESELFLSEIFIISKTHYFLGDLLMFGFGVGKIDVKLNNFNFKPGDTIEGTVSLTNKKNSKANGVKVAFVGTETSSRRGANGRNQTSTKTICNV